jgi:thymidylate synthase
MEIIARNVNELFADMLWRFKTESVLTQTRNGPALRIPRPVLTTLSAPEERVLFHAARDANPIFHLMESIWMLAGRRDVEFLALFNSRIAQYSDDGRVFNAAYGHRMRTHFRVDQLIEAITLLRRDPETRRCVVQLWEAADLTNQNSKDLACNTQIVFGRGVHGTLDALVTNRSNDAWYGYAGANAVHFTVIQELVARALGWPMGTYSTVTANLHLYTELYNAQHHVENPPVNADTFDYYFLKNLTAYPLMVNANYRGFLEDCEAFCRDPFNQTARYQHHFFPAVALPMAMVSHVRRTKQSDGYYWASQVEAQDWKIATQEWIARREKNSAII